MCRILIVCESSKEYTAIHKSFFNGFVENGCEVELFEAPLYPYIIQKISGKVNYLHKLRQEKNGFLLKKTIQKEAFNLIFVLKGNYLSLDLLKELKNENIKILTFNPDDPFNTRVSIDICREIIPISDLYFTWSKNIVSKIKEQYSCDSIYLPFALDKQLIYPVKVNFQKYDVSFIGNGDNERESFLQNVSNSLENYQEKYLLHTFGENWHVTSPIIKFHKKQTGLNLLKTISESKINLNLLRKQNKNSTNMRTFEIPGAGGFMMHEVSEEAMDIFKPNVDAVYFDSGEDLVSKIDFYLKHENQRKKITASGFEKANLMKNSYKERARTIINAINNNILR